MNIDPIEKYKALLADINAKEDEKKNNRIEMEFSWGIGMKDKSIKSDANIESKEKKKKPEPEKTHFEKILELKKEKKKARKEEQKKLRKKYRKGAAADDSDDDNENVDSDDEEDMPDGVDMNDPYFAEEFANGDFEAPKKSVKKKNKRFGNDAANSDDEQKKAELALLLDDDDGTEKQHFSLKKIQDTENESKTKRRRKKVLKRSKKQNVADKAMLAEDDFKINTADKRFEAIYTSHLYNIDPTNPNFKKTKGMNELIEEKLKRRPVDGVLEKQEQGPSAKKIKSVETNMLIKSIKRKVGKQ